MVIFINLLYFFIILFLLLAASFIAYHLLKYSLTRTETFITLSVFLSVFAVLIVSNLVLFFSLRIDQVIGLSGY